MTFTRYAIYYVPGHAEDWSRFAAAWLGWDLETGQRLPHPRIAGLDVAGLSEAPRRYGLHATIKPPMRLATGKTRAALEDACAALAARHAPVQIGALGLVRMGRFLALRPAGNEAALNALAAAFVTGLDALRAPPTEAETARRAAARLTPAQAENLARWGYPHVLDQFRFHITLTGKCPKGELPAAETALQDHLLPLLPAPLEINDLALAGEAKDGHFHLIRRFPLTG